MPEIANPERLHTVLLLGDNQTLLPLLVRQFNEAGVIPFVDAGLSATYNLPQWSELVRSLGPDDETRNEIEAD